MASMLISGVPELHPGLPIIGDRQFVFSGGELVLSGSMKAGAHKRSVGHFLRRGGWSSQEVQGDLCLWS